MRTVISRATTIVAALRVGLRLVRPAKDGIVKIGVISLVQPGFPHGNYVGFIFAQE